MLSGTLLIFIALCWDMVFPINKKLWTSSFVLLTNGIDLLLLSSLIYIVEIAKQNAFNWTKFFLVLGKNPLTIYLLSEVLAISFYMIPVHGESFYSWINNVLFQQVAPGPVGSLLFAITFMLLCWSVGWWIDKRQHHRRSQLLPDRVTA
jgi:predicted acyltransferase